MVNKLNSLAHTKWLCKYHIVFTPKYRRKLIYNQYRRDLREYIRLLCKYKGVEIIEGHMMPDHVHLLVSIPPKLSVSQFMGYLKGKYNSVYFIGLEDSAFWNFKNSPEEERKTFFVAISRAKNSLSFSYCKYRKTKYDNKQTTDEINEFYELFKESQVVEKRTS